MNSLNILSSRVISGRSASGPSRPRSRSQESLDPSLKNSNARASSAPGARSYSLGSLKPRSTDENDPPLLSATAVAGRDDEDDDGASSPIDCCSYEDPGSYSDEQVAALTSSPEFSRFLNNGIYSFAQGLVNAIAGALKALLSALASPALYLLRAFYEEHHGYSPLAPLRKLRRTIGSLYPPPADHVDKRSSSQKAPTLRTPSSEKKTSRSTKSRDDRNSPSRLERPRSRDSFSSCASDSDVPPSAIDHTDSSRPSSSSGKTSATELDRMPSSTQHRRSIRIELNDEGTRRRQRQRRQQQGERNSDSQEYPGAVDFSTADMLKSPMSSTHKITKYPHSYPVPPRPLIPLRQPSYGVHNNAVSKKTLILDLDETLIHSLAKGGRMSSGHMVEVRLTNPVAAAPTVPHGAPTTLGPQHPILYYVHKRPHCDDFLRKVCKWYKLVVFTASVQEYADPVIDWLEQERKYFHSRFYRQHCTFRQGAYVKDLSSVEPDLSKVMILDNSPMSYIFHADNAIPIQGWISDPTDNDLLNLIPILEAMQYVTDVRALLALRKGEIEA
ncbi:Nuclear envelope morphology protein 1 [Ascosphaera pollenicola]|nr:Nuclear envelope morphology protein 1 [Ascosphaera pollenicola]